MKKLIIIDSYLTSKKKENILKGEIESLKGIGFDIMLVAHYPISTEIQFMVDYFIFDKNQTLDPINDAPYYWFGGTSEDPFILVYNGRYRLAICQNMFNAFQFAEVKGYDFVYFAENDNFFSENDAKRLNTLIDEMLESNKKCIFFKPEYYKVPFVDGSLEGVTESFVYETQFFGITPKYFNEVFKLPTNQQEWDSYKMGFTLEVAFYEKLVKYEDNFLIINEHSSQYFSESKINQIRAENFIMELLYNIQDNSTPVLFFHNNYKYQQRVVIKVNNVIREDNIVNPQNWAYREFKLNGDTLTFEVYDQDDVLETTKSYVLDNKLNDIIIDKGKIDFTKKNQLNK
jgi:hypothetical protein